MYRSVTTEADMTHHKKVRHSPIPGPKSFHHRPRFNPKEKEAPEEVSVILEQ